MYEDIACGVYEAEVAGLSFGRSPTKQTPRVRVHLESGGKRLPPMDIWLTPKAAGMMRKSFQAIGFDPDTTSLKDLVANPDMLNLNPVTVEVFEEEWNGKFQKKTEIPKPKVEFDPSELDALSAAMREVKGSGKKRKPPTNRMDPDAAKGTTDFGDDVPF